MCPGEDLTHTRTVSGRPAGGPPLFGRSGQSSPRLDSGMSPAASRRPHLTPLDTPNTLREAGPMSSTGSGRRMGHFASMTQQHNLGARLSGSGQCELCKVSPRLPPIGHLSPVATAAAAAPTCFELLSSAPRRRPMSATTPSLMRILSEKGKWRDVLPPPQISEIASAGSLASLGSSHSVSALQATPSKDGGGGEAVRPRVERGGPWEGDPGPRLRRDVRGGAGLDGE